MNVVLVLLLMWYGQPLMSGSATHYDEGTLTRSEEPFDLNSFTCGVDDSMWAELRGKTLVVLAESGRFTYLRVNDTGYLRRFTSDWIHPGVVDVPRGTFLKVFESLDTQHVWVWLAENRQ